MALEQAESRRWLALSIVVYFLVYGWLLIHTDFLPYVMDNNESFSSLWHARNLFEYGLSKSFGLADEAFSPHEAAHPYVHTHQGNFPRLFAFLIYALGARSIESQIAITTFTAGLAAIWLIHVFFARIATQWFAFTVCAIFMTDYVLFAQWHVVTYRVWHAFLLFAGLIGVQQAVKSEGRQWWPVALATAGLFYYELVFAAFAGMFCFLFAATQTWRSPKVLARIVFAQSLGAAAALAVFFSQAAAYLGVDDLRRDFYITFLARNDFPDAARLAQEAASFYESRKVIFWFNIGDRASFAGLGSFVRSFTSFDWRVHTPMLSMAVWVVCGGWLVGSYPRREREVAALSRRKRALASAVLFFGAWIFVQKVYSAGWTGVAVAGGLTVLAGFVAKWVRQEAPAIAPAVTGLALAIIGVVLGAAGLLFSMRSWPFDRTYQPVWAELQARVGAPDTGVVVFTAAVIVACYLAIAGTGRVMGETARSRLLPVAGYLACGATAYAVVYMLSPGYIFSGYLMRHAPFTVFLTDVVLAIAFCAVVKVTVHAASSAWLPAFDAKRSAVLLSYSKASCAAVSAGLAGFFVVYWCVVQTSYVSWLPPTHYAFLKSLAAPPYQGASFVTDNYAAPVAAYTGQWAYPEYEVLHARVEPGGALHIPGDKRHLWLADRDTNPDYRRPQYYLCMIPQTMWTVRERIANETSGAPAYPGCSTRPLVNLAKGGGVPTPAFSLVAYDRDGPRRIGFDSWAIVRLRSGEEQDDHGIMLDWSGRSAISRPVHPVN